MKLIYRFLFKELLLVSFTTIGVLTFLLVLVNVFKDVFDLLLNTEVSLMLILKLVFLLIPWTLTYTLPWGLLIAVLLVFGRLSQDRELLAMKASGIGLAPLIAPAIWLAILFSFISFFVNSFIAPQCRLAFKEIGSEVVTSNPISFFTPGQPIDRFPGFRFYIGSRTGNQVEDVFLWQLNDAGQVIRSIRADRGEIRVDALQQNLVLHLYQVRQEDRPGAASGDVSKVQAGGRAREMPLVIPFKDVVGKVKQKRGIGVSTINEITKDLFYTTAIQEKSMISSMLTEIQKRIAFSFSCLTFVLVGVPLAIQTGRRETSVGVAMSLGVVIAYYFIVVLAEALKSNANVYPEIIIWAPNLIFQTLGFIMIWRVNQK